MTSPADHIANLKADAQLYLDTMWEENLRAAAQPNENCAFLVRGLIGGPWWSADLDGNIHGDPSAVLDDLRKQRPNPALAAIIAITRLAAKLKAIDSPQPPETSQP